MKKKEICDNLWVSHSSHMRQNQQQQAKHNNNHYYKNQSLIDFLTVLHSKNSMYTAARKQFTKKMVRKKKWNIIQRSMNIKHSTLSDK